MSDPPDRHGARVLTWVSVALATLAALGAGFGVAVGFGRTLSKLDHVAAEQVEQVLKQEVFREEARTAWRDRWTGAQQDVHEAWVAGELDELQDELDELATRVTRLELSGR